MAKTYILTHVELCNSSHYEVLEGIISTRNIYRHLHGDEFFNILNIIS
jgi:hypothetical protein